MTRPAPNAFSGELTRTRTRLFWAIEINFPTPLRVCSRQQMNIGGFVFEHAGIGLSTADGLLAIVNEKGKYTSTFYNEETAGVRVTIYTGYGEGDTWSLSDLREEFDGQLGDIDIGREIVIALRQEKPQETPGLVLGDVIPQEHLIPDGAVANTSTGKVKLTYS